MRRHHLLAAAAVLLAVPGMDALAQSPQDDLAVEGDLGVSVELREEVRDSFIFVFRNSVTRSEVGNRANAMARAQGGAVSHIYTTAVKGFAAKMPPQAAQRMAAQNPIIDYYVPDGIAYASGKGKSAKRPRSPSSDPVTTNPCSDTNSTQIVPWGIDRVGGSDNAAVRTAWVIDTGIDLDHRDLNVDLARSRSFYWRDSSPDDGNGHGTHVAGTIAAIDNSCDVVGVAAGATVVAVRVLDNRGSGSWSAVIAGIDYVAQNAHEYDVANMSLGGSFNQAVNDAVIGAASKGILFALAAGNSSVNAMGYSPASAGAVRSNIYPIYTVSAIDSFDEFAYFSNYGNPPVYCAAPGVGVESLKRGGGTIVYSGTSMAAPHVAGLLLLHGLQIGSDGTAFSDPDGEADPICHKP